MVSFFEGFKENIKGQKRNVRKNLKEIFSSRKKYSHFKVFLLKSSVCLKF